MIFTEASKKSRPIGAISGAWCAGYAAGRARAPREEREREYSMVGLVRWFRMGYRHGLKRFPEFEQLEIFDGAGEGVE